MFLDIAIDRQPSTESMTKVRESTSIPWNVVARDIDVGVEAWNRRFRYPNAIVAERSKTEGLGVINRNIPKQYITFLKNQSAPLPRPKKTDRHTMGMLEIAHMNAGDLVNPQSTGGFRYVHMSRANPWSFVRYASGG